MITRTEIKTALRDWIIGEVSELGTGDAARCVFEQQGAPHPAQRPYATVKVGGVIAVGQEHKYGWGTDPGIPEKVPRKMAGDRKVTASVQFFGEGALDYARVAAQGLAKPSVMEALALVGLAAPVIVPDVLDLTDLNEDFEERGQFDCTFLFGDTYTDDAYVIESATGTGTFEYPEDVARGTISFDTKQGV